MPATYIILVNWNGRHDTIECLESLLRQDERDFAVLIVDNGSRDGSLAAFRAWSTAPAPSLPAGPIWTMLPQARRLEPDLRIVAQADLAGTAPDSARITVIDAGTNLGFAAANNVGMAFAARDPAARFFWILNNDTVVRPDALGLLAAHGMRHPEQAIVGATLLYYHDPSTIQGLGGWSRPSRALAGHIGFGSPADAPPALDSVEPALAYVMGAAMFVRRDLYDAIGGMSEAYFLYFEELDWAKRLPAGARQGLCPAAIVYHKEGGSIGTSSLKRPSDTSLYYYTVNTLRFFWWHERRFAPVAAARVAWNAIGFARRGDRAAVAVIARAASDALTGRRRRGPYRSTEFETRGDRTPI